jgi:hypothetical protein
MDSSYRVNSSASNDNFKASCDALVSKLAPYESSLIASILACNNSDEPEIELDNGEKYIWYLAIGSMTNPISLYLRELIPITSYPATCVDYKITFRGATGMADIEMCLESSFDGVVHLLSSEQMARLDTIEAFYQRVRVTCRNYQNQTQIVYAYQMSFNQQAASVPHERYLDVIIKGCEYYQVREEYIEHLRTNQPVIPRKKPDSFRSFNDASIDVVYSQQDLEKHNGDDPSLPLWVCINGKILEYKGLPPIEHPDHEFQHRFYTFTREKFGGREVLGVMASTLYEPLYKVPMSNDDLCDEHRARIEDHYFEILDNAQNQPYWQVIGRLRSSNASN